MRLRIVLAALLGDRRQAVDEMNALTREIFFHDESERLRKAKDPAEVLRKWLEVGALRMSLPTPGEMWGGRE